MNKKTAPFFTLLVLAVSTVGLSAAIVEFEFFDGLQDEPANAFFGDVISGLVVMDTVSGDCSVTWNSGSGAAFVGPMNFELYLINTSIGEVIALNGSYSVAFGMVQNFTYNVAASGLEDWLPTHNVSTDGILGGVQYGSAIYSVDFGGKIRRDSVVWSGVLMGEPVEEAPADVDGDGVPDDADAYDYSDLSPTVWLNGENTYIPNLINGELVTADGYSLSDVINIYESAARESSSNHGQYVQQLVKDYRLLVRDGLITQQERVGLIRLATRK